MPSRPVAVLRLPVDTPGPVTAPAVPPKGLVITLRLDSLAFARILVAASAFDLVYDAAWAHRTTLGGTVLTVAQLAVAWTLMSRVPIPAEPCRVDRAPCPRGPQD
ncbi:hypothetical protein ACIQOW_18600 [Kitasatospora sp. NPDC091335]|uniref:hypothetical protein n=1 Tax=Kitasatospora sp. NPDC091335 TaxID=3364085 RepID=UPI0037FAE566